MAALTSTMAPLPSIVMMQSKAALRIADLRASLSRMPRSARQRSTNWPICDPRLPIVASSSSSGATRAAAKNSMTPSTSPARRIGKAKAECRPACAAACARGSGRGWASASAIHADRPVRQTSPGIPWPAASITARLAAAKAATGEKAPSHVCSQRRNEPSASVGVHSAPKSHARAAPMAASRRG